MKQLFRIRSIVVFLSLACWSCEDPPELVAKREQQKAEISRLRGELAIIEEKLNNIPPDVSEELETARKTAEEQTTDINGLESEIKELQARKRDLQSEFDSYRAKYQIK
jgi:chromosome segregation ATPase